MSYSETMAKNEEGEFELVLGNRQLLSGFFIVVILFGVFFTMGYIVGRHSTPTLAAGQAPTAARSSEIASNSGVARAETPTAKLEPGEIEVVSAEAKPAERPQPRTTSAGQSSG